MNNENIYETITKFCRLDIHAFTENYMYEWKTVNGIGKIRRTTAYNSWLYNFESDKVLNYINSINVDWTQPVQLHVKYICKPHIDVQNLNKATIDALFGLINANGKRVTDNIVQKIVSEKIATCKDYKDGKIFFCISNC